MHLRHNGSVSEPKAQYQRPSACSDRAQCAAGSARPSARLARASRSTRRDSRSGCKTPCSTSAMRGLAASALNVQTQTLAASRVRTIMWPAPLLRLRPRIDLSAAAQRSLRLPHCAVPRRRRRPATKTLAASGVKIATWLASPLCLRPRIDLSAVPPRSLLLPRRAVSDGRATNTTGPRRRRRRPATRGTESGTTCSALIQAQPARRWMGILASPRAGAWTWTRSGRNTDGRAMARKTTSS